MWLHNRSPLGWIDQFLLLACNWPWGRVAQSWQGSRVLPPQTKFLLTHAQGALISFFNYLFFFFPGTLIISQILRSTTWMQGMVEGVYFSPTRRQYTERKSFWSQQYLGSNHSILILIQATSKNDNISPCIYMYIKELARRDWSCPCSSTVVGRNWG